MAPLGYGPLASWAEAHTRALHSPPAQVPLKTTITGGANQALEVRGVVMTRVSSQPVHP